ncbi:endopeptidase La [Spirochaeta lutea]|uniref:Lon protease n=1 Tax=Spirochaeta lutea TaxID=1480694 RepID=A0A098QXZ3_9SPIO|nr:endopeptidase La [Spirochaeta lutea]KGE72411.1 DNA-binding protein [Spirochaeta lutea]
MGLFDKNDKKPLQELPFIALRDAVIFPHSTVPIYLTKPTAVAAVEAALTSGRRLFVGYVKDQESSPSKETVFSTGTVCRIVQIMKLPNNTSRVLLEGLERAVFHDLKQTAEPFTALFNPLDEDTSVSDEIAFRMRALQEEFEGFAKQSKRLPKELVTQVTKAETPHKLISLCGAAISAPFAEKLELLQETEALARLENAAILLATEKEVLEVKKSITDRVKKRMEQNQKEYFLNEQIKEMHKELGKDEDDPSGVKELEQRFQSKPFPEEVQTRAASELKRLARLQNFTPEAGILRTYLDWLADLPWVVPQDSNSDDTQTPDETAPSLEQAQTILEAEHYGLEEPKERILDYIAVRSLKTDTKGPILCFVGPPGTGKTSLGRSVAHAMGRAFVRISLGGVRDEAEIRGHRRTYVGALPGKIIQGMKKAGTPNPVFLLDEIDKIGMDHRGDPASALLEVLDPEQNNSFVDHYLELPFDLSQVIFITTANSLHTIPYALRDRMEVIQIPGYTENEKRSIAKRFLIPRQIERHGLNPDEIQISDEAIKLTVSRYTMESGVRNLERELAKILRKTAREKVQNTPKETEKPSKPYRINVANLHTYLGKPRRTGDILMTSQLPGLANGMAWTEVGGKLLPVETAVFPGKGELVLTGSLGDVMKESARIALTLIKQRLSSLGLPEDSLQKQDLHVHVPEGAIPKDGPSAGITLTCAMISALSQKPLKQGIAMTGEITLTGRVLPVGGIKEKVLAAHRNHLSEIILPKQNDKDRDDLPQEVLRQLSIHLVETLDEVLSLVFP